MINMMRMMMIMMMVMIMIVIMRSGRVGSSLIRDNNTAS